MKGGREEGREKNKKKEVLILMWTHWNTCRLLVGLQNGAATMENSMDVPQNSRAKGLNISEDKEITCSHFARG